MTQSEKIQSNASVHGVKWAATYAAKKGINIDTVLFSLFGRYAKKIRTN